MPYSVMQLPAHRKSPPYSTLFDRWSVGIIMLEVLLGTGAVMSIHNIEAARKLIELGKRYID
jgi:hypothetical protein